jgi:hypothetical protein
MRTKIKLLTVSVLVLVGLCLSAYNTYASGGGFEGRHRGMLAKMIGLTDTQKSAIKAALKSDTTIATYRSNLKTAMPNLIAARKALKLDTLKYFAGNGSLTTITNDMANVTTAKATVEGIRSQLRIQVLQDIQGTLTGDLALTPAQLTRLNQIITFLSE